MSSANNQFRKFAHKTSERAGSPFIFILACSIILVWFLLGPVFGFSDTWQLVINTSTTIITFLMVFLIQNTQNRDARAIHLKLDELIRADIHARNALIDLEDLTDEELDKIHNDLCALRTINEQQIEAIKTLKHRKRHRYM